jgi:hypothetical protein
MESIRPDNANPVPLRSPPHRVGTILMRFVGLLFATVVVMALIWNR